MFSFLTRTVSRTASAKVVPELINIHETDFDSKKSCQIQEVLNWGSSQCGVDIKISVDELKEKNLDWVNKLFPKNGEELEEYLAKGDVGEIKVKYVLYHCLMEIWYMYNKPNKDHKKFVFDKVMYGKCEGWEGCENVSEALEPSIYPVRNIDYYSRFEKKMFDCIGI